MTNPLTPAQIFGHLNPVDVLQLARTTKALRDILMRRSALSVWKYALGNVEGLPDCPSDLAEPQWAALVFDTLCHVCNIHVSTKPSTHLWAVF